MTNIHIARRAPLTTCTKVGKIIVTEKRNVANRSGTTTCKKKNNNNAALGPRVIDVNLRR